MRNLLVAELTGGNDTVSHHTSVLAELRKQSKAEVEGILHHLSHQDDRKLSRGIDKPKRVSEYKCPVCNYRTLEKTDRGNPECYRFCSRCNIRIESSGGLAVETPKGKKRSRKVTYRDIAKQLVKDMPLPDHNWQSWNLAKVAYSLGYDNQRIRKVLDAETFNTKVAEVEKQLARLPKIERDILKVAYCTMRYIPREDRADLYQTIVLRLLEVYLDTGKLDTRFYYTVARNITRDWHTASHKGEKYGLEFVSLDGMRESEYSYAETNDVLDLPHAEYSTMIDSVGLNTVENAILELQYEKHSQEKQGKVQRQESGSLVNAFTGYTLEFESSVLASYDTARLFNALPKDIKEIVAKRYSNTPTTNTERSRLKRYVSSHGSYLHEIAGNVQS